jgi:hypothetical protein
MQVELCSWNLRSKERTSGNRHYGAASETIPVAVMQRQGEFGEEANVLLPANSNSRNFSADVGRGREAGAWEVTKNERVTVVQAEEMRIEK